MAPTIRHLQPEDYDAVHQIFLSRHVIDGSMRLPFASLEATRKRLEPGEGVISLVALDGDAVIGFAELMTFPQVPRHRHAGEINMIATREDWLGKGVGRRLMEAMIDLCDNWLQITRLGLTVWTTNTSAIRLYESLGFTVEGTMPAYAVRDGEYIDAHMMGRLLPGATA